MPALRTGRPIAAACLSFALLSCAALAAPFTPGNIVVYRVGTGTGSLVTTGSWNAADGVVSTYKLVGPQYFNFFAYLMAGFGVLFIGVAVLYRGQDHVRAD